MLYCWKRIIIWPGLNNKYV